jgi:hypothetical protein
MARSRRSYRRSTTQRAASLLALALPAPMQRVADTRLGPVLMLLGIPAMVVGGLLNINWDGGQPQLTIDRTRAAEIRQEFQRFDPPGTFGQIRDNVSDLWNSAQTYTNQYADRNPYNVSNQPTPPASFPSTTPHRTNQNYASSQTSPGDYGRYTSAGQQPYTQPLSPGYQQPQYQQPYPPQQYQTQTYQTPQSDWPTSNRATSTSVQSQSYPASGWNNVPVPSNPYSQSQYQLPYQPQYQQQYGQPQQQPTVGYPNYPTQQPTQPWPSQQATQGALTQANSGNQTTPGYNYPSIPNVSSQPLRYNQSAAPQSTNSRGRY